MKEPIWIDEIITKAIHADQIIQHGGSPGIRDENLLSASLARPRNLFTYGEANLFELAAAYGYSLAKNHPFIDGNKRTAFAVMATFLLVNNYLLEVAEPEVVRMMTRPSKWRRKSRISIEVVNRKFSRDLSIKIINNNCRLGCSR